MTVDSAGDAAVGADGAALGADGTTGELLTLLQLALPPSEMSIYTQIYV